MGHLSSLFNRRSLTRLSALLAAAALTGFLLNTATWLSSNTTSFSNQYVFAYATNWLGTALFYSGVVVGLVVTFLADTRTFFSKTLSVLAMFFFFCAVWFFVNEANTLNLFLYYELFLLPSFFIVYFLSPNRRSILAAVYFLTWTQFGSLLVLVGVLKLQGIHGGYSFETGAVTRDTIAALLILLGFGIKIPMWPFYYWLTKTHVEASSFFSIYLSGFLVKTAVYLFVKFYSILDASNLGSVFLSLFVVGVVDSSIKMWHQTDLKKLIAYTTVQEMNLLVIPILFNDVAGEVIVALFVATHCILSSLLFFYIDVVTKRFATRATSQITGLTHVMPTFGAVMFATWLGFTGLPYTIKFTLELWIFTSLLTTNALVFIILIVSMNVIGLIGFSKHLFNSMFGAPIVAQAVVYDLTRRELSVFVFLLANLVLLNSVTLFA